MGSRWIKMRKTHKIIDVDSKWIESNIKKPDWQRNLYPARVNNFINHIKNKTFRDYSTVTVAKDKDNGHLILLDGQHKLKAIEETKSKYKMDIVMYEGLTEQDMMDEYNALNDVKSPRPIDDIKMYVGRNDIIDSFLDEKVFPLNITLTKGINAIRIDKLLHVLWNGKMETIARSGLTRKKVKAIIEDLTTDDFVLMKDYCLFFKKCYGDPFPENWVYKNLVMFSIMRFWIKNKDRFKEEELIKVFKRIANNRSIEKDSFVGDIVTLESMTHKMYRQLNFGRSANLFEKYWLEEEELRRKKKK